MVQEAVRKFVTEINHQIQSIADGSSTGDPPALNQVHTEAARILKRSPLPVDPGRKYDPF